MEALFEPEEVLREGRYTIEQLLRQAPEKQVYVALDAKTDSRVALDVFANNATMPSGLTVSAWEAHVLGNLGDHPNIGQFIDHWEDDRFAVMVSRYWSGGRLSDRIERASQAGEALPVEEIADTAGQIADGLAHIHGRRILYRDLQPPNVLFDQLGNVRLVDFDTAVSLDQTEQSDLSHREVLNYMAPEMLNGAKADERADLFSLGATLYEMCVARPAFAGDHAELVARHRDNSSRPTVDRDDIPEALRDLVTDLLASDPSERPDDAAEVVARLKALRAARADLERLLRSDETKTLEFKSSLRVPVGLANPAQPKSPKELQKDLEHEALKTIAAFLNTEGGTLIIGVDDDGELIGIEVDFPRVKGTRDGWRRTFDQLVSSHLGTDAMTFIDLRLEPWRGGTIAVVRCRRRDQPTWLHNQMFVRRTASTEQLDPERTVAWYRERWGS